jgi:hypothetical protein
MAETPRFAHLMILLLMGTELAIALSLAAGLFGVLARRWMLAMLAGAAALGFAVVYGGTLLGVGWLSGDKVLAPGRWKYFCEADCHIAYAIESVQMQAAGDAESRPQPAQATRVAVLLETWFDENSIASFRGNAPLKPEPRSVVLVDSSGRSYSPLPGDELAFAAPSTPMTKPLRPGESYLTDFVFEVPRDARDLRLLVTDVDPASHFIIDHENSPFHGKILLRLADSQSLRSSMLR